MKKPILVSPSILCADFTHLAEEIKKCEDSGADLIHIDVMDGHFVPNITIGQVIVKVIRSLTHLPIESHLMIENPSYYFDSFIEAGSDIISIHAECYGKRKANCQKFGEYPKEVESMDEQLAKKDILKIKSRGKKAFLALNPGTPLCLNGILQDLDGVLIMSVNPGFSGQKFMPIALSKIQELRRKFHGDIEVDGGINKETASYAVSSGANILVTASYFFGSSNPKEVVSYLKALQ